MSDTITNKKARSPIASIAWVLAGTVCLFAVENIWIDPWVARRSHHRLPSFVPEALGGIWFLMLLALGVTLTLAVFCQVLLMRDARLAGWKKALTGTAVLGAAILASEWFVATGGMIVVEQMRSHRRDHGGMIVVEQMQSHRRDHAVTLHWQASITKNVRYNIYRGLTPGFHPDKLNSAPIDGLTFIDTTAENRTRYYYVARAVDATGQESSDSNETLASVP
jgi:hypothetical protein